MTNAITDFEEQLLAGSTPTEGADGSKKLMVDLLHDKFGADDLVEIKNFTKKKTGWVYSDQKSLRIEQPNEFTRRVWQGEQKVRVLEPGKSVIVPGWEAYVGLVRFYKQYISEEFPNDFGVKMNSPKDQAEFINKAYMGIYDPNKADVKEAEKEEDTKKEVENDLGLVDEKPKAK